MQGEYNNIRLVYYLYYYSTLNFYSLLKFTIMETKFNELMILLNNPNKEKYLRILFNESKNLEKIELITTIEDFLGVKKESTLQSFNRIVLNAKI